MILFTKKKFYKIIQELTIVKIKTGEEMIIKDLCLDSLSIIQLITMVEKEFNIQLADDFLTVQNDISVNEFYL
ncbi:hypothetical protein D7105_14790, partial [Listeria monocytogenes]|nr:hypothetical protein [Listeria monocytogenes]EGP9809562.1 hypothetical protein [Listeria monocytogenes]EGT8066454.1 hypothetical protein [Listeria monocytogenes]HBI2189753.1 hypothetical protein [Listeria monocytogenes]